MRKSYQRRVTMSPAPFESNLDHRLHFLLKQILPIANFQIRLGIATSFLRRGIRLFSFQKSPAGGELDDSHATPKSSLNILRYGRDFRLSVPLVNLIRDRHFSQPRAWNCESEFSIMQFPCLGRGSTEAQSGYRIHFVAFLGRGSRVRLGGDIIFPEIYAGTSL